VRKLAVIKRIKSIVASGMKKSYCVESMALIKTPKKRSAFKQIMKKEILSNQSDDDNASTLILVIYEER